MHTLEGRIMRVRKAIRAVLASVSIPFILSCAGCGWGRSEKPYCIWKIFELRDGRKAYRGVSDDWAIKILREDIDDFLLDGVDRGTTASNDSTTDGGIVAVRFPPQEQESEIVAPPDRKPLFPAHCYFANASPLWQLTGHYKPGQHDIPISEPNDATSMNLRDAAAYCDRGIAHAESSRYDRAISDYSKALEIDPRFAKAFYNRGVAYYRKGQHNLAISDYARAIEMNPQLRKQDDLFVRVIRKKWASFKES
jgi:tetratricopeptide (TPR) repeat protein